MYLIFNDLLQVFAALSVTDWNLVQLSLMATLMVGCNDRVSIPATKCFLLGFFLQYYPISLLQLLCQKVINYNMCYCNVKKSEQCHILSEVLW